VKAQQDKKHEPKVQTNSEKIGYKKWSARLEMCQWRRETLDKESIWDEARSTNLSRW
jgi:hypothetical protein